jgi:hypothetical protein
MRTAQDSWNATPVNDPRRLELMRCAYQKAVAPAAGKPGALEVVSAICPDCVARWRAFYGVKLDGTLDDQGRVTSLCLGAGEPWFAYGTRHDIPKHCDCLLIGHYCDLYVWVLPGHRDEFARLVLAILDYAVNLAPMPLTKDVTFNIDSNNKLNTGTNAVRTIKATIPINTPSLYVLQNEVAPPQLNELHKAVELQAPVARPPAELPLYYSPPLQNTQPPDFQWLNQRLQLLNPIH